MALYYLYDENGNFNDTKVADECPANGTLASPVGLVAAKYDKTTDTWSGMPLDQWTKEQQANVTPKVATPDPLQQILMQQTLQLATLTENIATIKAQLPQSTATSTDNGGNH